MSGSLRIREKPHVPRPAELRKFAALPPDRRAPLPDMLADSKKGSPSPSSGLGSRLSGSAADRPRCARRVSGARGQPRFLTRRAPLHQYTAPYAGCGRLNYSRGGDGGVALSPAARSRQDQSAASLRRIKLREIFCARHTLRANPVVIVYSWPDSMDAATRCCWKHARFLAFYYHCECERYSSEEKHHLGRSALRAPQWAETAPIDVLD